jgi:hypothetical protein
VKHFEPAGTLFHVKQNPSKLPASGFSNSGIEVAA